MKRLIVAILSLVAWALSMLSAVLIGPGDLACSSMLWVMTLLLAWGEILELRDKNDGGADDLALPPRPAPIHALDPAVLVPHPLLPPARVLGARTEKGRRMIENRQAWLDSLQVGDVVAICSGGFREDYHLRKVDAISKARSKFTIGGQVFNKRGEQPSHSRWTSGDWISEVTDEICEHIRRRKLLDKITSVQKWSEQSTERLTAVAAALDSTEPLDDESRALASIVEEAAT